MYKYYLPSHARIWRSRYNWQSTNAIQKQLKTLFKFDNYSNSTKLIESLSLILWAHLTQSVKPRLRKICILWSSVDFQRRFNCEISYIFILNFNCRLYFYILFKLLYNWFLSKFNKKERSEMNCYEVQGWNIWRKLF